MKKAHLYRVEFSEDRIRGFFVLDGVIQGVTLELPDRGNQQDISCIPTGTYICKRVNSSSFGDCFTVTNVPGRTKVRIHLGNYPHNTTGCILLACGIRPHSRDIYNSKVAIRGLMDALSGTDEFELEILDLANSGQAQLEEENHE